MTTNRASYEGHEEDRAKIVTALGGTRGLIDSGLPSLLFLVAFNVSHKLNLSLIAALILSALLTIMRLVKRETLQHAISGLAGIAVCALLARHTGKAKDFYLPGLITNVAYGILYSVLNLVGWPLIGLMLGPLLGENLLWRKDPARRAAYIRAGWLWVALFISRLVVQYPLYRSNNINALGTARLIMGYPLFIAAGWGTWQILRKVPTTKIPEEN
ncbi:MAG: DUF3159 domain-containing protein [Actinomycetes bacterium]